MASRPPTRPNIVVVCPECGHRQDEPRFVVSTICRRCLTHVEVRDGVVVGPFRSAQGPALGPPSDQRPPTPGNPKHSPAPLQLRVRTPATEEAPEPAARPALPSTLRIRSHASELVEAPPPPRPTLPPSLRIRSQPVEDEPQPPPAKPLPMPPSLRIRSRPTDEDPEPPPAAETPRPAKSTRRRATELLEKWLRPEPPKRAVLCIECGREFQAPAAADTTNCPKCGCYMSLRDFVIDGLWDDRIETRGNVTILRKGKVNAPPILCHHLTIRGSLETSATCSGDLAIRVSARFRTKLRCAKLLVQKRARVEFIHPVETGEAVIDGSVTGSIRALGTVTLLKRSRLRGNITATRLILKPGATHTGTLRIIPSADPGEDSAPGPP